MLGHLKGKRYGSKIAFKFPSHRGEIFLISNFRSVPNFVCFPMGNSSASEFHMPTFRTLCLFHLHTYPLVKLGQGVGKLRHIKFRPRGITQKKAYKIRNRAKV